MTEYIPHRRSSGKRGSDGYKEKIFSYYTKAEREQIEEAAKVAELSLSSFVAKAAKAQAVRVLGNAGTSDPLSLEDVRSHLRRRTPQSKVIEMIRKNGVRFHLSADQEDVLRSAGATTDLLFEILKAVKSSTS